MTPGPGDLLTEEFHAEVLGFESLAHPPSKVQVRSPGRMTVGALAVSDLANQASTGDPPVVAPLAPGWGAGISVR
jgi:hypothetical protein